MNSNYSNYNKNEMLAYEKGYRISDNGCITNPDNKIIDGFVNNQGYIIFSVRDGGILKKVRVHRLVAYQKYKNTIYKKGYLVRHLDNNKLNNKHSNIVIGTHQDNMLDIDKAIRIRSARIASSVGIQKYSIEDVIKIREYHKLCKSYRGTMSMFDIPSKGSLHYILNKRIVEPII